MAPPVRLVTGKRRLWESSGPHSPAQGGTHRHILCGEMPGQPGGNGEVASLQTWDTVALASVRGTGGPDVCFRPQEVCLEGAVPGKGVLLAPRGGQLQGPDTQWSCPPYPGPVSQSHLGYRLQLGPPAGGGWWTDS